MLSDRQGYTFGYGLQWKGTSTTSSQLAIGAVLEVLTKAKPTQMIANAQTTWLDPIKQKLDQLSRSV